MATDIEKQKMARIIEENESAEDQPQSIHIKDDES